MVQYLISPSLSNDQTDGIAIDFIDANWKTFALLDEIKTAHK